MRQKKTPAQVTAKAPKDGEFPELKKLTYKQMYNLVEKFIKKAIPIKGAKLTVINGMQNRVSTPKAPFILLQIESDDQISTPETRYTNKHKITWARSQITMGISFFGNNNIAALEMAKSFTVRFNDAWASEQFAQYSDIFFPLYSDDARLEPVFTDGEDQFTDKCSVTTYFEHHPEFGMCENSAKEISMNVNIAG
ncbi:unnamed protein product [Commensalibacter communis]|uniref:Phage neck terminator protein gp12-like domain-containing protein n=1 Tax=Commensalibacter communis TaxID=2972786 RepID=A0A9W4TQ83_9PROT|nr:hypothetical protein [Commensalibacter communis]CAI3948494.1 unnamed protein product [Commensalibacter communis]CAI3948970.1 unnamed protein product [Commensalibacter communis]CAI3949896.1 unnamed protein product [Commensalibacter communis]CAI3954853.1 unnamed protein product [Commensalibacter communis]CAI3957905.1 unnamed protein product [Commensalibacter communis]